MDKLRQKISNRYKYAREVNNRLVEINLSGINGDSHSPIIYPFQGHKPGFPLWLTHQKWDIVHQISSKGNRRSNKENPGKPHGSGVLGILKSRSALAELRSAAGGFEAVLR